VSVYIYLVIPLICIPIGADENKKTKNLDFLFGCSILPLVISDAIASKITVE